MAIAFFNSIFRISKKSKPLHIFLGFKPNNESFYIDALTHNISDQDVQGFTQNERLEFLGDSVLSTIVSNYLIKKYPTLNEGYLTDMRSKIVNRVQLNEIGEKMRIKNLFKMLGNRPHMHKDILGNTIEAIIGAIFLDKSFHFTSQWTLQRIVIPYIDFTELEKLESNPKNKLLSWGMKNNKEITFDYVDNRLSNSRLIFTSILHIDNEFISQSKGKTKKEASLLTCKKAIEILNI